MYPLDLTIEQNIRYELTKLAIENGWAPAVIEDKVPSLASMVLMKASENDHVELGEAGA